MHFAFLGNESLWAAEASECAADQDAFWEYHDYLFVNLAGENRVAFDKENLIQFAIDLDLDSEVFSSCLNSGKYAQLVLSETGTVQQLGVQSTPSFLVNGQPIIGAQPFESFQTVIEFYLNGN